MFVGHTALALAAKARALDLLWPVLPLLGLERLRIEPGITAFNAMDFVSYPWSHSLLMALVWGGVLAAVLRKGPLLVWTSSPWSPPPPSERAVAWVGLASWLFVPWAAWIDRYRTARA